MSYLRFWPTLSTLGSSSRGFRISSAWSAGSARAPGRRLPGELAVGLGAAGGRAGCSRPCPATARDTPTSSRAWRPGWWSRYRPRPGRRRAPRRPSARAPRRRAPARNRPRPLKPRLGRLGRPVAELLGEAGQNRAELVALQEGAQISGSGSLRPKSLSRLVLGVHVVLELDQAAADPRQLGVLDQVLAALGLLDLLGPRQQGCSRSPYSAISWAAVLMPMPGTPGTLSTESPASAWTSTTFLGRHAELLDHLVGADLQYSSWDRAW